MRDASAHGKIAQTNQETTEINARSISELTGPPIRRGGGENQEWGDPYTKSCRAQSGASFPNTFELLKLRNLENYCSASTAR